MVLKKSPLIQILQNLGILVVLFTLSRVLFYLFNRSYFEDLSLWEFIMGVRFDLSLIAMLNIGIVFFQLIPISNYLYQRFWYILFIVLNSLALATQFVDMAYFPFTLRRSDVSLITAEGMREEMKSLWWSYLTQYWYLVLIFILFIITLIRSTQMVAPPQFERKKSSLSYSLFGLLILGFLFLAIRGGTQKKPLRQVDANYRVSNTNAPLVLNTPFVILKSIGKNDALTPYQFYTKDEINTPYPETYLPQAQESTFQKKNVIIFILESFGKENIGFYNTGDSYTPFLDSLIEQSYSYKHSYANGKVSIDALPSVICSIPAWYNTSYIHSKYVFNTIESLPKLLGSKGYYTAFYHGAFNGSQNFDRFAEVAGFDHYFGKNEYPDPNHDDGRWGIWDEEFLAYFHQQINQTPQPFFTTLFTLSSHNPYKVPEKYQGKFPKGTNIIHESIGYTDMSIRKFFGLAQKEDWYSNTLFVFTADHTSQSFDSPDLIEKMKVPIFFFDPSNPTLKGESQEIIQQIDIMPWVMNYLKFENKFLSFGNKNNEKNPLAIEFLNHQYWVIEKNTVYVFNEKIEIESAFDLHKDYEDRKNILQTNAHSDSLTMRFRYLIQEFNQRNIHNKMKVSQP